MVQRRMDLPQTPKGALNNLAKTPRRKTINALIHLTAKFAKKTATPSAQSHVELVSASHL